MKLKDIGEVCSFNVQEDNKIEFLTYDSRKVKENSLFFAIKGHSVDGNVFVKDLLRRYKNIYVLSEKEHNDARCFKVFDVKECMGRVSSAFFKEPSKKIDVVGITGTNGKTTTTYLLRSIFKDSEIMGTTGYTIGDRLYKLNNTTPESLDIHKILSEMVRCGSKKCFMEISSHAITLNRIAGVDFKLKVFTNISQDHLDYYKTMDNYAKAKLSFFEKSDKKVVNIDDNYAKNIVDNNSITYGFFDNADIYPKRYDFGIDGIEMDLSVFGKTVYIKSNLIGKYNIYNIMCAVGVATFFNKDLKEIENGIRNFKNTPGRLEFFKKDGMYAVVDYAHTDDAMENVLSTLKQIKKGRLIVVFGAGGDRDKSKRPKMGKVADELADIVVVTSDNPRSEDPDAIIGDILNGINRKRDIFVEKDREKAIISALDMANKNDIVAILGKGHEDYQILNNKTIHFDDREVIRKHWKV